MDAFVGDELIPDAEMVFDRVRNLDAPPAAVWPWLVQLGKHRAGWYLPARMEWVVPKGRRAARTIEPRWQSLAVGDRVDDYGGKDEQLEVVLIDPPAALVYRSERFGTTFTWALLVTPRGERGARVHLRFRGRLRSRGWRRLALVLGGDIADRVTAGPMLAGLVERVAPDAAARGGR